LCVLETLGGESGFLADRICSAGGADFRLIPERPLSLNTIETLVRSAIARQGFALVVASEGYPNLEAVVLEIEQCVGLRLRFARPSHTMRGGKPSAHDRMLARALAEAGVDALTQGKSGMVAWHGGKVKLIAFDAVPQRKTFRS
jgi:6-phosphofructokinase 1